MTRHVPISEFKDHASELVAAAQRGERIVITRHGKPTVALNPVSEAFNRERAEAALARMLARREALSKLGVEASAAEWIAWKREGQR